MIVLGLLALIIVWIGNALAPEVLPFDVTSLLITKGNLFTWIGAAWPILLWGLIFQFSISFVAIKHNPDTLTKMTGRNLSSIQYFGITSIISLRAGVYEEIIYRWLLFFSGMFVIQALDFVFLGFLGLHIVEWFQVTIFIPVTSWVSFGYLDKMLYHEVGWYVGAALVVANTSFRDQHKHLGVLGWLNSWCLGLFLFWMVFTYGLLAAIVAHALYDIIVFSSLWPALKKYKVVT